MQSGKDKLFQVNKTLTMLLLRARKRIILYICIFMAMIWYTHTRTIQTENHLTSSTANLETEVMNLKYILQWTNASAEPFIFMGKGQTTFIERRCPVNNCYITSDRRHLNSLKDFDAVLFHGPEISYSNEIRLPEKRSPNQKFVFVSMESSRSYPIRLGIYDTYFNWTWTYKLNSEIYYGYIIIKNKQGDIIGPKEIMHWPKVNDMTPIDDKLKERLKSKRIAAAWFVSNCQTSNTRFAVAKVLQRELAKYNLKVDIYGDCGPNYCPRTNMNECLRMLETDYYFYLAYENSNAEDYVTEKLLHALQHYTIPIVYGGANYTRFMADGTYLDVRTQSLQEMAKEMFHIINNKEIYYNFFRWTNHYSYHKIEEFPESDSYCNFCTKINDINLVKEKSYIKNFKEWWKPKCPER